MKIEDLQLVKRIIEGVLMASDKPLSKRNIKELFDDLERPEDELIDQALQSLEEETAERGYELKQVASGYRFQVKQDLSRWVSKLWKERSPRYSRALLETLSLVAYRQPITRGEVEEVRGVAVSTQIIKTLLEREWVKVVGHRDVPGRPAIYATTKQFLDYFNLKSLDQLPPLAEIRDLNTISREFNIEMPEGFGGNEETLADAAVSGGEESLVQEELLASEEPSASNEPSADDKPSVSNNLAANDEAKASSIHERDIEEMAVFEQWVGDELPEDAGSIHHEEPASSSDDVSMDETVEAHAAGASAK